MRAPRLARLLRIAYTWLPRGSRLRRDVLVIAARGGLEAFNRRDWPVFVDQYAPDAEYLLMPGPGALLAPDLRNRYVGPAGVREFFHAWDDAWESFEAHPDEVIDMGNRYLILLRLRCRARGSGLEFEQRAAQMYEWERGMIVRAELYGDQADALAALGLAASPTRPVGKPLLSDADCP